MSYNPDDYVEKMVEGYEDMSINEREIQKIVFWSKNDQSILDLIKMMSNITAADFETVKENIEREFGEIDTKLNGFLNSCFELSRTDK